MLSILVDKTIESAWYGNTAVLQIRIDGQWVFTHLFLA